MYLVTSCNKAAFILSHCILCSSPTLRLSRLEAINSKRSCYPMKRFTVTNLVSRVEYAIVTNDSSKEWRLHVISSISQRDTFFVGSLAPSLSLVEFFYFRFLARFILSREISKNAGNIFKLNLHYPDRFRRHEIIGIKDIDCCKSYIRLLRIIGASKGMRSPDHNILLAL